MKGIEKIKNKMRRINKISNVKTQSSNEINAMTNVKNQTPCLLAESREFDI
jgi:hypothetical protein